MGVQRGVRELLVGWALGLLVCAALALAGVVLLSAMS